MQYLFELKLQKNLQAIASSLAAWEEEYVCQARNQIPNNEPLSIYFLHFALKRCIY